MNSTTPKEFAAYSNPDAEALTFAEFVSLLLRRRRLLLAGVLAGLLIAGLYVWFASPFYRSQGVFNLQYIGFAEYKRYSPALMDRERFMDYAARSNQFSAAELDKLRAAINGPDALTKFVHPLFAITKTDVKDAAEAPKDANLFAGVDIDVSSNSREFARKLVLVFGVYVRDFVLEGKIYDLVMPSATTFSAELTKKELDILRANFDLEQLKRRRAELAAVASRYPSASRESQRQVISTQDGGERYLSPVTQVIGVEAQIVEANADLASLERDKERLKILIDFYRQARDRFIASKTGEQLAVVESVFKERESRAGQSDAALDAIGTIRVELDQLRALTSDYMRFAGAPSSQAQFRSILVWSPIVIGPLVGLLLAMLAAIILEWWRRNGTAVLRANRNPA